MDILHLREQQRIEKNGDGEEECQKPALQQKTTDNDDDDDDAGDKKSMRERKPVVLAIVFYFTENDVPKPAKSRQHNTSYQFSNATNLISELWT